MALLQMTSHASDRAIASLTGAGTPHRVRNRHEHGGGKDAWSSAIDTAADCSSAIDRPADWYSHTMIYSHSAKIVVRRGARVSAALGVTRASIVNRGTALWCGSGTPRQRRCAPLDADTKRDRKRGMGTKKDWDAFLKPFYGKQCTTKPVGYCGEDTFKPKIFDQRREEKLVPSMT